VKAAYGLIATLLLGAATTTAAAPVELGMTVQGRVGYGSNPYLAEDDNPGSLLAGIRISPELTTRTATSTSSLSGYYDYTRYARRYGHTDTLAIDARHKQQFSPTLSGNIHAGYLDSLNALFGPIDTVDEAAIGRRQRIASGDFSLTYQPNARDNWDILGNISHAHYPGEVSRLSDYTNYGGGIGYSRAFSENTRIGARFTVGRYDSDAFADTTSYQPSLTLRQRLGSNWTLDGRIGAIFQHTSLAGLHYNSTSLGFGATLCRQVPRYTLCFDGSRDTSPSGLGGLRTETRGSASFNYTLSERSNVSLSATYGHSKTGGFSNEPDQDFGVVRAEYTRRLTERISIGGSVDYRHQRYEGIRKVHAVAGALNITAQIGRMH